ncbi:MAG: hypothetical protein QOI04_750 [Verrucomicrobiota bacterium]|jgi:hypothetical protein
MLRKEIAKPDHPHEEREWMSDDYFDLIIWHSPDDSVKGFQLCYDKTGEERALTWIAGKGFSHTAVDTGEADPLRNRAPTLSPNGSFPSTLVLGEFEKRASALPVDVRTLIRKRITEYAGTKKRRRS